jgi:hypothetical protein
VESCSGEIIDVTGELNLTTRITVDNRGKTHIAFTLVPSNVRGKSADGTRYKVVGSQQDHFNSVDFEPPLTETFTETFNFISDGSTDNFNSHIIFHITITADGTVRTEVERIRQECHG